MKLTYEHLTKIVRAALTTRDDEIDCETCFDRLDRFAEEKLAGRSPEEAMPLVQAHLDRCSNCREEFEALLDALRAIS